MPGRPAVTGALLCIPIAELRPHAGLLMRAHYLPEPGKAKYLLGSAIHTDRST